MKKTKHALLAPLALLVVLLGGCATAGNASIAHETKVSVAHQLVKGRTTEAEVRALYGDPVQTSFTDKGNAIWTYTFTKSHVTATTYIPFYGLFNGGTIGKEKELVLFFNKNDVLKNYQFSNSNISVHTGI